MPTPRAGSGRVAGQADGQPSTMDAIWPLPRMPLTPTLDPVIDGRLSAFDLQDAVFVRGPSTLLSCLRSRAPIKPRHQGPWGCCGHDTRELPGTSQAGPGRFPGSTFVYERTKLPVQCSAPRSNSNWQPIKERISTTMEASGGDGGGLQQLPPEASSPGSARQLNGLGMKSKLQDATRPRLVGWDGAIYLYSSTVCFTVSETPTRVP